MLQRQTQLLLIIALVLVYHLCESKSNEQYPLQHNGFFSAEVREEAPKLLRIKLSESEELDSFESLIRSHNDLRRPAKDVKSLGLNSQLVGVVGIGTPTQEFKFVFDTNYANMWVPSMNCTDCGEKKRYDSSASSTYIEDGRSVGIGWEVGFRSIDQVSLGGVIIKNQTFAEITHLNKTTISTLYDGLFSLAFDRNAQEDIPTPLQQMVEQELIDKEVVAIYQNSTGGEILFGGFDPNLSKDPFINWVPNFDLLNWSFRMDSLSLAGGSISEQVKVCQSGCKVVIYTHYPYIVGPPDEVRIINEAIGAQVDEDDDSIFVLPDCNLSKLPNLVLTINDNYELTPEQYIQKVKKGDQVICVSSLHAVVLESENYWIIGSSVIGHIYTIFDHRIRAIGLAHPA